MPVSHKIFLSDISISTSKKESLTEELLYLLWLSEKKLKSQEFLSYYLFLKLVMF